MNLEEAFKYIGYENVSTSFNEDGTCTITGVKLFKLENSGIFETPLERVKINFPTRPPALPDHK